MLVPLHFKIKLNLPLPAHVGEKGIYVGDGWRAGNLENLETNKSLIQSKVLKLFEWKLIMKVNIHD